MHAHSHSVKAIATLLFFEIGVLHVLGEVVLCVLFFIYVFHLRGLGGSINLKDRVP